MGMKFIEMVYNNIPSIIISFTVAGVYYFRGIEATLFTLYVAVLITIINRIRMDRNNKNEEEL